MVLIMRTNIFCAAESKFLKILLHKFVLKRDKWHGLKRILSPFQGSRKQHGRIMTWKGNADNNVTVV